MFKILNKKADMEQKQVLSLVILGLLLCGVVYFLGPGVYGPLREGVVNAFNSVLVKFGIGSGTASCKSVDILKKQVQLCFDESTGCWADLGSQASPAKYAVKWDESLIPNKYILLYYDNIKKNWENVEKTIPDEETINLFGIYDALDNANDNGMRINFKGNPYRLFLSERGLGIRLIRLQEGDLPEGEYHLSIGNTRGFLFRVKDDERVAIKDLSAYEKEIYYALADFSLNFNIKINEVERKVSFGEVQDGLKSAVIMYVSVDGVYYGINYVSELFIKSPEQNWIKKPKQKVVIDYNDPDYSPLYDILDWNENIKRKQIKDELITACEEF